MMRAVLTILSILALAALLVGCQGTYDPAVLRGETFTINSPYVVLDSPELVKHRTTAVASAEQPWWMTRNDARLNVRPGSNIAGFSENTVVTRDRQYNTDESIHDSYRRDSWGYTRRVYGQ